MTQAWLAFYRARQPEEELGEEHLLVTGAVIRTRDGGGGRGVAGRGKGVRPTVLREGSS
jgi:hypothetical protein